MTTDRPTAEQKAEWRRLADAATPGPWVWREKVFNDTPRLDGRPKRRKDELWLYCLLGAPLHEEAEAWRDAFDYTSVMMMRWSDLRRSSIANATPNSADRDFIAAARTAMPALLAEAERLEERVKDEHHLADSWQRTAEAHLMSRAEAAGGYAELIIDAMGHDPNRYDSEDFPVNVVDAVKWQAERLAALLPLARAAVAINTYWQLPPDDKLFVGAGPVVRGLEEAVSALPDDLRAELEADDANGG